MIQDFKDSLYLWVEWKAFGSLIFIMVMPGNPGIYLWSSRWNANQAQRDGWILQGRKAYVCNRKPLWALAWLTLVESLVGQIASRCRRTVGLDEHWLLAGGPLWKTMFWSSRSQTPCSARNQTEAIESCEEKCANLCRVYKLIMISRVPSYGHLEYVVLNVISSRYFN